MLYEHYDNIIQPQSAHNYVSSQGHRACAKKCCQIKKDETFVQLMIA